MSESDRFYDGFQSSQNSSGGEFLYANVISIEDKYKMIKSMREYIIQQYELDFDLIIISELNKHSIKVYADISKKIKILT